MSSTTQLTRIEQSYVVALDKEAHHVTVHVEANHAEV